MEIERYRVTNAPPTVYYIPDFITKEEELCLHSHIYNAPKPKWTCLSNRRLQNWGGLPHPKGMVAEPIPQWLQKHMDQITQLGVFGEKKPNHVLVNEYEPGQGIMPHEDGPLFYPTITTINVGSHTILNFYSMIKDKENDASVHSKGLDFASRHLGSLLLEPRSLLVVQEDMYTSVLHGIEEVEVDEVNDKIFNLDRCHRDIGEKLQRET
ncbi:putative RNA/DNA demethylase ALKBH6 [Oratosquilla oratoria]|uniref:putative RNA/DNA demethylase ALKBH6 n=1 Tax=Oratosquilla oratoria TaxID=337810 RepID=UPI003F760CB8